MYTEVQLEQYFQHINYPKSRHASDPLELLTTLQKYHQARVPFESVTLHYSQHRLLSLDPQDLFDKIVGNSRGGYCMEVNAFLATILRSMGFTLITVGARVMGPAGAMGWCHMSNLITIDGQRYLVDVGFGSNSPIAPIPLKHGHEAAGPPPSRCKLEYRNLPQHNDPSQRVWVYSTREGAEAEWVDGYSFVELEFFPEDFAVMNLSTMTSPTSLFVQSVVAVRTVLNGEGVLVARLNLFRDYLKEITDEKSEVIQTFRNEDDRIQALETYFLIKLSPKERRAIRGLASELRDRRSV